MNAANIIRFIRAGNATFTIQSVETGAHFTYNVRRAPQGNRGNFLFVKVLIAPETYAYLGALSLGRLVTTRASRISESAASFKALAWFMRELSRTAPDATPAKVIFRHEGKCGRCGRALTTPASIDTGLGPDCAEILGVAHEAHPPANSPVDAAPEPAGEIALRRARLAAITCTVCHGKRDADGRCSDCGGRPRGGPALQQILAERRAAHSSD